MSTLTTFEKLLIQIFCLVDSIVDSIVVHLVKVEKTNHRKAPDGCVYGVLTLENGRLDNH